MYEVFYKDTKYLKFCPICVWQNVVVYQTATRWKSFNTFSTSQKTGCQWLITSALPWCCCRWLLAACPAILRAGGCKRTCYLCPLPTCVHAMLSFCPVFGRKFNTKRALFLHQSPTSPQKIDSREGWFWCKKGTIVNAGKMNIYFKEPQFALYFGLFGAKHAAFCC